MLAAPPTHQPPLRTLTTREVAVRKVIVDQLCGITGADVFIRTVPALIAALGPHLAPADRPAPATTDAPVRLSPRQLQVLQLAADGRTNARIAARLGLSTDGVKSVMRVVFERLGARDRAHAVALAYQAGLLR